VGKQPHVEGREGDRGGEEREIDIGRE